MPKTIVFKDIPEDGFFLSENNESNLTLYRKWKNWGHVFDVVDNRIINIPRFERDFCNSRKFRPKDPVYLLDVREPE